MATRDMANPAAIDSRGERAGPLFGPLGFLVILGIIAAVVVVLWFLFP